jgi:DNA-directed RNA polymerase specialized sigma24 family protein
MESLTDRVLRFQRTGEGLRDIVDELAPRVYHFPRRTMGWDEDACGDFYVFIHPRLLRLVRKFRDQGRPFESYLWAVLNWQLRNFARDRGRREREWGISLRMGDPSDAVAPGADRGGEPDRPRRLEVAERVPFALPLFSPEMARTIRSPADRRNFLFLVLKCSRLLDPAAAGALAPLTGVAPSRLLELAGTLCGMRAPRERRLEKFRCRRNKAFSRVLLLEAELKGEVDAAKCAALRETLRRTRQRMHAAVRRMSRVGMSPTNREIAAVLGVPKGTVDSGLYWLKRKLAAVYDPDNLRSA